MVAASSTPTTARPSLLPSEKDQQNSNNTNNIVTAKNARKPRGKSVPSRYLSPSPSSSTTSTSTSTTTTTTTTTNSSASSSSSLLKRFASPLLSRSSNLGQSQTPRSQSADRRRSSRTGPATPNPESNKIYGNGNGNVNEMSNATKMLITSTRRLSVSFQGEAFSLPISKAKTSQQNVGRKGTPERRRATPVRDQRENSLPGDQQRWPARSRQGNLSCSVEGNGCSNVQLLSRSLDCSDRKSNTGSGLLGIKSLSQSIMMVADETSRRLSLDLGSAKQNNPDAFLVNEGCFNAASDLTASDSESVSSGSTSGLNEFGGGGGGGLLKGKGGPRGIVVSARFWQETNSRLRRLQDLGSPVSSSPGSRTGFSSKSKRFSSDGPLSSPRTTAASPIRGATRASSPSKLWTASSPSRGMPSPSRARPMNSSSCMPSILNFSVDLRRGKMGEDRIVDAHILRLLYNRYLQWRFVNARADATFMVQQLNAENSLWNAWVTISELRHSVIIRRIKLLLLRQKLKLTSVLKGQINHLENWSHLDRDHSSSLEGATEALKASTLRLPVVGKAVADVQNIKDAIGSAVDVMQAMGSSIRSLSSKVEEMNSFVAELVNVTAKEKASLGQCKDFLSMLAAMQVKDCSLRTHIIQLNRLSTASSLTTHV